METTRQQKVARLLQRDLGSWFQRNGPRYAPGGMITVTVVRISPDLSLAKVYLSIFATPDKLASIRAIAEDNWLIRRDLAATVGKQLRIVPELNLYLDDSLDEAMRIEQLLNNG